VRHKIAILLVGCVVVATPAAAQGDDAAYCAKLTDFALRYCGNAGGEGRSPPDIAVTMAIEDCRKGNPAAGIQALLKKIRGMGFTPPSR
jgi:hypothetical protein